MATVLNSVTARDARWLGDETWPMAVLFAGPERVRHYFRDDEWLEALRGFRKTSKWAWPSDDGEPATWQGAIRAGDREIMAALRAVNVGRALLDWDKRLRIRVKAGSVKH